MDILVVKLRSRCPDKICTIQLSSVLTRCVIEQYTTGVASVDSAE